jgi:hypothetical protein
VAPVRRAPPGVDPKFHRQKLGVDPYPPTLPAGERCRSMALRIASTL